MEGADEMRTVIDLGISGTLRHFLTTTNAIENLIGTTRRVCGRVKRWRNGAMVMRWVSCGILEAEAGFRRISGYRELSKLEKFLRENDQKCMDIQREFDSKRKLA